MKQSQQITQSLGLAQRQLQTMRLLAMTATELGAFLEEAALENPVIEVVHPDVEAGGFGAGSSGGTAEPNWDDVDLATAFAPERESFLLSQVDVDRLSGDELRVLRYLIGMIDESGYLTQTVEQAALCLDVDRALVSRMVDVLHGLEPHGIGARTVRENLLLQLDALAIDAPLAHAIVRDHMALLAKNRVSELERALPDASREDVLEAIGIIRSLDPRPGSMFAVEQTHYVLADVVVEDTDDGFAVRLGPAAGHDVRLDSAYRSKVANAADLDARDWVEEKYRQAYWLRSCLKQRRELMLAVTEQLVRRQKAYFMFGPRRLCEVTMSQVAEDLSLSVSTVSRAAKGAYLQCRWGVVPLRSLFTCSSVARDSSGGDPRTVLRDIVAAEDRAKPLSDQKLVEEFASRGIAVSRRTVARYRQDLGIPPASDRRYR